VSPWAAAGNGHIERTTPVSFNGLLRDWTLGRLDRFSQAGACYCYSFTFRLTVTHCS